MNEKPAFEKIEIKGSIRFQPERISREMLYDSPEMRVALMCLEKGQSLEPHKAPLRLLMYCLEGRGTFSVGEEEIVLEAGQAIACAPMVPHGFRADRDDRLVVMAVVTAADSD